MKTTAPSEPVARPKQWPYFFYFRFLPIYTYTYSFLSYLILPYANRCSFDNTVYVFQYSRVPFCQFFSPFSRGWWRCPVLAPRHDDGVFQRNRFSRPDRLRRRYHRRVCLTCFRYNFEFTTRSILKNVRLTNHTELVFFYYFCINAQPFLFRLLCILL